MNVDKFGRYETAARKSSLRGPPGVGFKTTAEGDYDMRAKRLRMVGEPTDANDAVTMRYVNETCLQLKGGTDAADNQGAYFDANKQVIRNLKDPSHSADAVTKLYFDLRTPIRGKDEWNFGKSRLTNVTEPKKPTDVVNKSYLDYRTPTRGTSEWSFGKMRLADVAEPIQDTDGVNLSYLEKHVVHPISALKSSVLILNTETDTYNARGKRVANLLDADEGNDAVNLNLLNAFRETVDKRFNDVWSKVEDELSSMAHMVMVQALAKPSARVKSYVPPKKLQPWRTYFTGEHQK